MSKMNPYYDYEKLDLEMFEVNEPDMSYEFNTLCFWSTGDGRVFSASDSGCSCPIPFENYESETIEGVLQQLERVGSLEQAEQIFDSWSKDMKPKLPDKEKRDLVVWFNMKKEKTK